MSICFVNYCTDIIEGGTRWKNMKEVQVEQARKFGATEIHEWNEEMLHKTTLYRLHKEQFSLEYGAGFIWRPYIILCSLMATQCKYILYLDCDLQIVDDLHKFTDYLEEQPVVIPQSPWLSGQFTRREVASALDADTPEYYNLQQLYSGLIGVKNNNLLAKEFLLDWLVFSSYPGLSAYNIIDFENEHPNFHAHRNQGALTILYHQYGFNPYPDTLIDITNLREVGGATLIGYEPKKWE